MRKSLLIVFVLIVGAAYGQAPIIQKVEPLVTFPNDTIIISGNGFSNTPSDLQVWFGPVEGTIVTSSTFAIEVIVPPAATVSNIEVRHLGTKQSARSRDKFMPNYSGTGFNVSKFSAPFEVTSPNELFDLCTCDFNDDGKPDIAATKFIRTSSPRFPNPTDIVLLRNQSTPGTLSFTTQSLTLNIGTDNAVCGDLDGDGKPDLIVTRSGAPRNSVHILRNTTAAAGGVVTFATPTTNLFLPTGELATRMSLFDLNRDGKSDLVVTNSGNDGVYIFTNTSSGGTLSFNPSPLRLSIKTDETSPLTYEPEVEDFNGDGLPDILIATFQASDIYLFKNTSTGAMSFSAVQKFALPGAFNRIASYDFSGDGMPDIAVTSTSNDKLEIMVNQSTSSSFQFAAPVQSTTSLEPWGIDLADFNGDGKADIAVANRELSPTATEDINIFINNGGTSFTKNDIVTPIPTRNIIAADYDGDGKPDLAYTSFNETIGSATSLIGVRRNANCHQPVILNEAPLSICAGQTIRLQTIPANNVTYTWKKDNVDIGGNTPFLDITAGGSYTVTATGEAGTCVITSTPLNVATGTGAAPATPSITSNAPLCSGQQLNLQTTTVPSATYIWTGPNGFTSSTEDPSKVVTAEDAGEYSLQVQVGVCKSNITTVRVDVVDFADFKISSSSASTKICQGAAVTLSVNSLANHSYEWKRNGAFLSPTQTGATFNPTLSGSYSVVVTHTILGCSAETSPFEITLLAPATAAFTVDNGCAGETLQFDNQSTGIDPNGTPVYSWKFGDSQISSQEEPTHAYASAGSFTARLTVSYQGVTGCLSNEASQAITITAATPPVITPSASSACPEEEVTLEVQTGFSSVTWNTTPPATTKTVNVLPGTYTVNTVDQNGCPGDDEITITALPVPDITITATPPSITAGESTQLSASPSDLVSYEWNPTDGLSSSLIFNPIATPAVTTTYTVIGTNSSNCSDEAEITVTVEPPADAPFPVAFSPNGDNANDVWVIGADTKPDCTLSVFDARGRKVFEKNGQNWDGTFNGQKVPDGTYYYVFACPGSKSRTGNVLVFK